jgi:trimethylamine--corrinoid protein Co-methyltransferase
MELLSADQLGAIHETSMRILEELGIELMSSRGIEYFRRAGATIDDATQNVRLDRGLVAEALKTAPSVFNLTPRNPSNRLILGGNNINYTMVAGPPNVHDFIKGRRSGNLEDYDNFTRLAQYFNAIHMLGNQVCAPVELPAETRHLDTYYSNLTLTDKSFHCTAIGRQRALDGIEMMAITKGKRAEDMLDDPSVSTIISVNSPRRFDGTMAEGLITMAEYGQACSITPFTLMGAMSPVTLAGALAQQNAEALFGVVLTQLVKPGAPVLYGAFTSNVDMRSGAPAFGTPENTKANVASGQLARRYGLPYRTTPGSASNEADAQGAYETMMALWGCSLGHGNLVYHAAGWQEGGLTASYEKFIIDIEMIQHMMEFMTPIAVEEQDLALQALADVPTGGHFFGEPHTLARYDRSFYEPILSNWQNFENWEEAGAKNATARATDLWQRALSEYQQPPMEAGNLDALDAYVAQRKSGEGSA